MRRTHLLPAAMSSRASSSGFAQSTSSIFDASFAVEACIYNSKQDRTDDGSTLRARQVQPQIVLGISIIPVVWVIKI